MSAVTRSKSAPASWPARAKDALWRLIVATVGSCFRNRVTGLAAEAAFFALLSLPPLIFGLAGSIGYVFDALTNRQVDSFRADVLELCARVFTDETVDKIIRPTLDDVLEGPRFDVISIGFVLALWSGSRALNVFVDTITIMYGLGGHRGIVRTRMLSFTLYVFGLFAGVIVVPLVIAGPTLVNRLLPPELSRLGDLYWPIVLVLGICMLATLYHVSVPVRTSWRYNVPGATLTMFVWVMGSFVLRWALMVTARESTSIYGPLAAPIAVLIWLYLLSIAVLIGAALNASLESVWPEQQVTHARLELVRRLRRMGKRGRRQADAPETDDEAADETVGEAVGEAVDETDDGDVEGGGTHIPPTRRPVA